MNIDLGHHVVGFSPIFEDGIFRVVAGKTKVFSISVYFNQESTILGKFQYTLGPKVYNSDFPKFSYL